MAGRELLTVTLPSGTVAVAAGRVGGLPAFRWGCAPAELLTRRQLAEVRLRPGRGGPVALLVWGHRDRRTGQPRRWAALYDVHQAVEKRAMTAAQRRALDAAHAARRVCGLCGPVDHYTRSGLCSPCYLVAGPTGPATVRQISRTARTETAAFAA